MWATHTVAMTRLHGEQRRKMVSHIENETMTNSRGECILDHIDPSTPFIGRVDFVTTIAAFVAVHADDVAGIAVGSNTCVEVTARGDEAWWTQMAREQQPLFASVFSSRRCLRKCTKLFTLNTLEPTKVTQKKECCLAVASACYSSLLP